MKITNYDIETNKKNIDLHIAVVADLHTKDPAPVIEALKKIRPQAILCTGDMFKRFEPENEIKNKSGFVFFEEAVKVAPIYYCFGNHEIEGEERPEYPMVSGYRSVPAYVIQNLKNLGIHMIFDEYEPFNNSIYFGGLVSARWKEPQIPNMDFAEKFSSLDGYKILICHHPEYYEKYLKNIDVDMILSGHAHGGQWRIFGRGVFAPGQGLFPKYTSGIHDNKLIISRGCSNNTRYMYIPRFFNPREVLSIKIKST